MWIEFVVRPERDVSRSDSSTVAVGFSPWWAGFEGCVAERRLNHRLIFNCRYATNIHIASPFRGLKPTATINASLREANVARFHSQS